MSPYACATATKRQSTDISWWRLTVKRQLPRVRYRAFITDGGDAPGNIFAQDTIKKRVPSPHWAVSPSGYSIYGWAAPRPCRMRILALSRDAVPVCTPPHPAARPGAHLVIDRKSGAFPRA